jgi:putative protease
MELLAPAGNLSKLKTAVYFGADAVYFAGKDFGLRAFSDNFSREDVAEAFRYLHKRGKKGYVTVNIFARTADFDGIRAHLDFLAECGADAVILSDPGVVGLIKERGYPFAMHLSTQANTLNKHAARFWAEQGVKRLVLARELTFAEVKEIRQALPAAEIEMFVHGAMCIAYSGRCLLSNYLSGRDGNRGECVQACRWDYEIREKGRGGEFLSLLEDGRGSYILSSKDLNLFGRLGEIYAAGVDSVKIEGRMKSEYYLATVIGAYRRGIDAVTRGSVPDDRTGEELYKTAHRAYTEAYFDGAGQNTQNHEDSQTAGGYRFAANVLGYAEGRGILVRQRNRFKAGDELEALSPGGNLNRVIPVRRMTDEEGNTVEDAKLVGQRLFIESDTRLQEMDILRLKVDC